MKMTKIISLIMAVLMIAVAAVSCGAKPDGELEIKINMLNGTTALGMAKMIVDAKNDADDMNYNIELFTSDISPIAAFYNSLGKLVLAQLRKF